jgi:transcriptional regulator with XRE-family HTH domain
MNKQVIYPVGAEQWLINLIDLRNKVGLTNKQIAEMENLAEKSVSNVFSGKSKSPSVNLIRRIITALGGKWREIFEESDAVIASQDFATLQSDYDKLKADHTALLTEAAELKEKNTALEIELDRLRLTLEHKEEIISLHNYYNKLKQ